MRPGEAAGGEAKSGEAAGGEARSMRPARSRTWRYLAVLAAIAALVLLGRVLSIRGLVREVRVAGHSMAPSLRGPHHEVTCADCRFTYACGESLVVPGDPLVCPNCGYDRQFPGTAPVRAGDRVLIDRLVLALRSVRRWEQVVVQSSAENRYGNVKRVLGLRGERIGIADGDLFVNGRISRKTIEQLRDLAVLVHDDRFRPHLDPELPDRWRPRDDGSKWTSTARGRACDATGTTATDWLQYDHWACISGASPPRERARPSMVYDHYGYNQHLSRGPLNRQCDLMVSLEFHWTGPGRLSVLFDRGPEVEITLDASRNVVQVRRDGRLQVEVTVRGSRGRSHTLEAAVCDRSVLVAVDGRSYVAWPMDDAPAADAGDPGRSGLPRIGLSGAKAEFSSMRLYRDLYLLGPDPGATVWDAPVPLGEDELFVAGDNVPVSVDSRNWLGFVDRKALVGKVLRVTDRP